MSIVGVGPSVLAPGSREAAAILHLWNVMWLTAAVVLLLVLVFVALALGRGLRGEWDRGIREAESRGLARAVAVATAATVIVLFGLLVTSVRAGLVSGPRSDDPAVTIRVIGHQWWWEIQYDDSIASRRVVTANEVHLPTNRPVVLAVTSRDVIHSFWVPNLQGKRDLIPGYTTALALHVDRPGTFRGQCAEFCGLQHAHMALDVVAEPVPVFEAWLAAMRQPAGVPPDDRSRRGERVFLEARCAGCHTVAGSLAGGQSGPDLTHLATRQTLGAGTLPNTPEHLASWIRDPQRVKPGSQMPPNELAPDDLQALVAYLETLR